LGQASPGCRCSVLIFTSHTRNYRG